MKVTLLATCIKCPGALALKGAALKEGYELQVESVVKSDERTVRSAELGIGLPVLVREDGTMSDDAKMWLGGETRKRIHVTHPVIEVIENADNNNA